VTTDEAGQRFRDDPAYRTIASYDPLTPSERAELHALAPTIFAMAHDGQPTYDRWSTAHPQAARLWKDLSNRGPRIDLFLQLNP
jgi:hypothetical protein